MPPGHRKKQKPALPSHCSWALSDEFIPRDQVPKHLSMGRNTFAVHSQLWADQFRKLGARDGKLGGQIGEGVRGQLLPSYPVLDSKRIEVFLRESKYK